jgi:hypothetical protein
MTAEYSEECLCHGTLQTGTASVQRPRPYTTTYPADGGDRAVKVRLIVNTTGAHEIPVQWPSWLERLTTNEENNQ